MTEFEPGLSIPNKEHYPYVTRSLVRLFNEGRLPNVKDVIVEPSYGYVSRIEYNDASFRVTYGNDLGLNTGASEDLAKDKGYTKFMLDAIGITVPKGREFLLPWWQEQIAPTQLRKGNNDLLGADMAPNYIDDELAYPVYVKPVSGSKGGGVYRVDGRDELKGVFDQYETDKVRVAVVEEAIDMPDYRLVILDGELISAYQRIPLAVVGNGSDTTESLIENLQNRYIEQGRDTRLDAHDNRIISHLGKRGLGLDYVPASDERLTLASISNLSAGGTSLDVSAEISPRWVELAAKISRNFNLRLCGVDLACQDIASGEAEYSVLEVNASPGLDHYASSGDKQRQIVDELYIKVLNTSQTNR